VFFMKRGLLIMGVTFMVTLATVFGLRVSADALAVIIGVILGIVASVPTTALVVYLLMRPRPGIQQPLPPHAMQQPPVVVINAADPNRQLGAPLPPQWPTPGPTTIQARKWTVIGDTETEVD
jgi:hypothetical protein